jgi:hypothetical protein
MKTEWFLSRILWSVAYLCLTLVALRVAIISQPVGVGAQQNQRKSLEESYSSNPQVRVTKLKTGPSVRQFKEEFDESDDWPRRLTIEVKNIGIKPIIYLQTNLNFPETRSSGNLMSYPIITGIRPNSRAVATANKPLRLLPGEKLQVTLAEHYDELERFIQSRHSMIQIHKAEVEIGFIIFEDGTAWAAGDFLRPDPYNPRHYLNVGPMPPN